MGGRWCRFLLAKQISVRTVPMAVAIALGAAVAGDVVADGIPQEAKVVQRGTGQAKGTPHGARQGAVAGPAAADPVAVAAAALAEGRPDTDAARAAMRRESRASRLVLKARSLLKSGDHAAAVKLLQSLLDRPDDPLLQIPSADELGTRPLQTLKDEAERLLRSLPPAGRRLYELQYGRAAAQKLAEALRTGSIEGLREVARRYPVTPAGAEATYRLGSYHLDHGEPLAALLCFERLRGHPETARPWQPTLTLKAAVCWYAVGEAQRGRDVLADLFRGSGRPRLRVAGEAAPAWSTLEEADRWMRNRLARPGTTSGSIGRDWLAYRGNAARNSTAGPANVTGRPAWTRSTLSDSAAHNVWSPERNPDFKARLLNYAARYRLVGQQSTFPRLPAAHPLIVKQKVVCRTVNSVQAYDLRSGELV
ncbi:MAG: hypothetical protein GXP27_18540, partial [Planctomycetes bacterium]|nr:hypothetical protein [Planctomycetota bacterium]